MLQSNKNKSYRACCDHLSVSISPASEASAAGAAGAGAAGGSGGGVGM